MNRKEKEDFIRKVSLGLNDLATETNERAMWIHDESDEQVEHVYSCLKELHEKLILAKSKEEARNSFEVSTANI